MVKYLNLIVEFSDNIINSSRHHIRNSLNYLVENYDYKIIKTKDIFDNIDNIKKYLVDTYGNYDCCNLIAFGGVGEFIENINKISKFINVCFIIDDIHHSARMNKPRQKVFNKSKKLFITYAYQYEKYFSRHNQLYFFPHSIAYRIEFNNNPIKKILVSGHLNKDIYPNRNLMYELSKQNEKIELFKPDYNGYRLEGNNNKTYGIKYYELLNKYLCCVVDDSVIERRYIVAKFFEILGCGSLLIAFNSNTFKVFEELGFINNVHYISINENTYKDVIEYVLDEKNIDQINEIRLNGYNFSNKYHHYSNRAIYLNKVLTQESSNDKKYNIDSISSTKYICYDLE